MEQLENTPPLPTRENLVQIDTSFDIELANGLAQLETYNKHHYRPNTYLHKWWARRCGTTFRLILKHLVPDPTLRGYYTPGGLTGKIIMDPMMGGATTLHEAIRLGANVIGGDIDPIPILQARATLSDVSLLALEQAYQRFFRKLRAELDPYFMTCCPTCGIQTQTWFVLYGARRSCSCGPVLVVDSLTLRQEMDGTTIRLCADCHAVVQGDTACDCGGLNAESLPTPLVEKKTAVCPHCNQPYQDDLTIPYYARYEPLVIVAHCQRHNLFFKAPDWIDREALQRADDRREQLTLKRADFVIEPGRKSRHLQRRGIDNYLDLFSSRQLLYLEHALAYLPQEDPLIQLNLALLVSTSLEFNSMLCGYKGKQKRRAGAIRHTFSHHAYSFPYTALENNPLYHRKASGTLEKLFQSRIRNGRSWARQPRERDLAEKKSVFVDIVGEVDAGVEVNDVFELRSGTQRFLLQQGSATHFDLPDGSVDAIVTDPPYFDSVQYSDLSAFFRVWLRQMLPDSADWTFNINDSAVDPHKSDSTSRYTELLSAIFSECRRVLRKDNGRFIFTFHHWNPKAWAALTTALKAADFVLLNRYVVHAENPSSVHINNMKALMHDAIFVCAPKEVAREVVWQRPSQINTHDSYQFCYDCATSLGWMLENELKTKEIKQQWQNTLS